MPEIILVSDALLAGIALAWLITASMQDIKKREVANWLNFSLVIIALGIRGIAAIVSSDPDYFVYSLVFLAAFFVLANIMYYGRIFAGGDAKLLIALGVVFATTPSFLPKLQNLMPWKSHVYQALQALTSFEPHFLLTFFMNLLFVGSLYGIVYSIVLAAAHKNAFSKEFGRVIKKNNFLVFSCLFLSIIFLAATIINREIIFLVITIVLATFPYLFMFVRAVENSCMVKSLKTENLTEGDWLARQVRFVIKRKTITIKPNWQGLSGKEISIIRKAKINNVMVKEGVPFVPVFLIALVLSFFANLLLFIVQFLI